jgi:hypothetical protein
MIANLALFMLNSGCKFLTIKKPAKMQAFIQAKSAYFLGC